MCVKYKELAWKLDQLTNEIRSTSSGNMAHNDYILLFEKVCEMSDIVVHKAGTVSRDGDFISADNTSAVAFLKLELSAANARLAIFNRYGNSDSLLMAEANVEYLESLLPKANGELCEK